jgi:ribose/xylose/arabinose/galactoside ABC-type transport system permease subunit
MLEIMQNKGLFNLSDKLTGIGRGNMGPVPNLIIFGAAGTVLTAFVLRSTVNGRRFYALGGDGPSAMLLGINPRVVLPLAFGFSGLLVGLAGLLHAGFYGQVQTTAGRGFELKAIAAAVIGGTHIMGGRGTAFGILLGALLLGVISNLLVFLHISAFWDNAVTGAVILVAVCADALTSRRERTLA